MPWRTWFIFDIGNVLIKLDYEKVLQNIRADAEVTRDELIQIMEEPGSYRDLERGYITFNDFHRFLGDRISYRANLQKFREVWSDFFAGPVEGMEELLERVRTQYRVAFLSNSNEVHAEVIPRRFAVLFRRDDRFIFSHRFKTAKPDPVLFKRALEIIGALPSQVVYVDDLKENVSAAWGMGISAFHFTNALELQAELEREGILERAELGGRLAAE